MKMTSHVYDLIPAYEHCGRFLVGDSILLIFIKTYCMTQEINLNDHAVLVCQHSETAYSRHTHALAIG